MRLTLALLAAAAACFGQVALKNVAPPATSVGIQKVNIGTQTFRDIEKRIDVRLQAMGSAEQFDILGPTRGLYLDGYGAVFMTEMSLIVNPVITPFRPPPYEFTPEEVAKTYSRKQSQVPLLKKAMTEMMNRTALTLTAVPDSQKIVLAVRMRYQPWERTDGLPALIVMTSDRKSAAQGTVQSTEVQ